MIRIHPGEVLLEEFLMPLGLSQYRLARSIGVPPRRINEIVHGKRAITADTALRLARFFGTSAQFWLNLQAQHDLEVARDRLAGRLEEEVMVMAAGGSGAAPSAHGGCPTGPVAPAHPARPCRAAARGW